MIPLLPNDDIQEAEVREILLRHIPSRPHLSFQAPLWYIYILVLSSFVLEALLSGRYLFLGVITLK